MDNDHRRLSTATLFVVSCSALMLELALTRVFSFILWYHMTYLVVGLALLGYGAAGTKLARRDDLITADYSVTIFRNCALFSLFTVVSLLVTVQFHWNFDKMFEGYYLLILPLLFVHFMLALPFYFAGKVIGFILMRNRQRTNRLYSADLLGAGAGTLLAVALINHFGAISSIFFAAVMPACVAVVAGWSQRSAVRALLLGFASILLIGATFSTAHDLVHLKPAPGKEMASPIAYTKWNILNRIDITEPIHENFYFGGVLSGAYTGPPPTIRVIYQDATAPTALVQVEGTPETFPVLGYFLQGAPYALRKQPASVLVLGFGGGIDGLIAEHAGARHVVGVDINPITLDLVSHRYRDFTSGLFEGNRVQLVLSEGRHYLTRSHDKFDVIQLSGVDTFAAVSAGSFALSESYLYTVEAVDDLLNRLGPNGILSYSRWLFRPPREALRLAVTIDQALRQARVKDPRRNILIVSGGGDLYGWADVMVKNIPFTKDEVQTLKEWAAERQFQVIYDPFQTRQNPFNTYLNGSDRDQQVFLDSYLYDVSPSRDDKPFFFQFYRWRNMWDFNASQDSGGYSLNSMPKGIMSLVVSLGEMSIFSLMFVLLPLFGRKESVWSTRQSVSWLGIFASLGFGFIAIEMVLMQKLSVFLGGPAYSMAVTLFALLVFSGVGSRISERLSASSYRAIASMIVGLLAMQGIELAFLDWGVPHLLSLTQLARCLIAIIAIAPLGLLMGMPFPTLLSKAGVNSETLIPLAWGVNACATVIGSVLSTIASMILGLSITWLLAMGMYFFVLLLVASSHGELDPAADVPRILVATR